MNAWQKLIGGGVAGLIWIAAIVVKHFWTDIDIGGITTTCSSVVSGLGLYHALTLPKPDTKQVLPSQPIGGYQPLPGPAGEIANTPPSNP